MFGRRRRCRGAISPCAHVKVALLLCMAAACLPRAPATGLVSCQDIPELQGLSGLPAVHGFCRQD